MCLLCLMTLPSPYHSGIYLSVCCRLLIIFFPKKLQSILNIELQYIFKMLYFNILLLVGEISSSGPENDANHSCCSKYISMKSVGLLQLLLQFVYFTERRGGGVSIYGGCLEGSSYSFREIIETVKTTRIFKQ